MTWNHRVMRTEVDDETTYAIHEVYYKADGSVGAWTGPVEPFGDTLAELRLELERMLATFDGGVLDAATGEPIP